MDDMTIKEMQRLCFQQAEKSGWHEKPITFSDMTALLHSEISEAYEEYRNTKPLIYYNENNPKPEGIAIEFADLAIRLFHYCEYLNIDLENAIDLKRAYNATRPYRHGNKQS
jgi:NTP pyrophosphatase (non-canonical NTP hydrolase)